eukprot:TRINITY_DN3550_c0_g2_i2.p1 TRINITY_DN3550_c0_g2~~TRINITY_DN3550_c0_g2_i2.p1  ORF type:complete len:301 (+),score=86.90 TRINITY_DN3550_c0_g2_i2:27-929(+)
MLTKVCAPCVSLFTPFTRSINWIARQRKIPREKNPIPIASFAPPSLWPPTSSSSSLSSSSTSSLVSTPSRFSPALDAISAISISPVPVPPPSLASQWVSKARRTWSIARRLNLNISPRKLLEICIPLRKMNIDEALIQLELSRHQKASFVASVLRQARTHGVNNFNMDPTRMLIDRIEIGRGSHKKTINYRAKGRVDFIVRYRSHLLILLREVPPVTGEVRLGKFGRKIDSVQRALTRLEELGISTRWITKSLPTVEVEMDRKTLEAKSAESPSSASSSSSSSSSPLPPPPPSSLSAPKS